MTDDGYNPFKSLDKSKFKNAEEKRGKKKRGHVPASDTSDVSEVDESVAFSRAMGGVAPMNSKGNVKGTKRNNGSTAQQNALSEASDDVVNMEELDAFRKVKKLASKKGHISKKIKRSHEESNSRERSRDAVASAPPREIKTEEDSFAAAMQGVRGLSGKGREIVPEKKVSNAPEGEDPSKALQDILDGNVEFKLEYSEEYMQGHVQGLDPLVLGKMRAGQYSPEGHLDLHGMIAQEAYDALVPFIRSAYVKGKRTVLLIPGRGKNSPEGFSVLKQKVEHWLTREPFKRVVLAFCTAQPKDGGAGALYVLLRKYKKSRGKIYWDKTPHDPDLFY